MVLDDLLIVFNWCTFKKTFAIGL